MTNRQQKCHIFRIKILKYIYPRRAAEVYGVCRLCQTNERKKFAYFYRMLYDLFNFNVKRFSLE